MGDSINVNPSSTSSAVAPPPKAFPVMKAL